MSANQERDDLVGAICRLFHGRDTPYQLAGPEQKRAWEAARELQRLGATPQDVETAARNYRSRYPTMAYTPRAVVGRFTELLHQPGTNYQPWECPDRYIPSAEEQARARDLIQAAKRKVRP